MTPGPFDEHKHLRGHGGKFADEHLMAPPKVLTAVWGKKGSKFAPTKVHFLPGEPKNTIFAPDAWETHRLLQTKGVARVHGASIRAMGNPNQGGGDAPESALLDAVREAAVTAGHVTPEEAHLGRLFTDLLGVYGKKGAHFKQVTSWKESKGGGTTDELTVPVLDRPAHFWVAMHELGHQVLEHRTAEKKVGRDYVHEGDPAHEKAAWEWALAHGSGVPFDTESEKVMAESLGSYGLKPADIEGKPTPTPPEPMPDSLKAAYDKGHKEGADLHGGNRAASVKRVTLSDGTEAVLKNEGTPEHPRLAEEAHERAVKEVFAGHVANLLGVHDVSTVGVGNNTTLTHYVEGRSGNALLKDSLERSRRTREVEQGADYQKRNEIQWAIFHREMETTAQGPNGREIGLLDWLVDNPDRHEANWLQKADGRLVPIDHGNAGFTPPLSPTLLGGKVRGAGPFAAYWTGAKENRYGEVKSLKPRVSQQYLAGVRQALESHKQDFAGRPKYYDAMMKRLAVLEAKAPKSIPGERPFGDTAGGSLPEPKASTPAGEVTAAADRWYEYAHAAMIKDASRGSAYRVGSHDLDGEEVTPERSAQAQADAKTLQAAAMAGRSEHKVVYRGFARPGTYDQAEERYHSGAELTLEGLTATSGDRDGIARTYTDVENAGFERGEAVPILLAFHDKAGVTGLDRQDPHAKPGEMAAPETILPHGAKWIVDAAIEHEDGTVHVNLVPSPLTTRHELGKIQDVPTPNPLIGVDKTDQHAVRLATHVATDEHLAGAVDHWERQHQATGRMGWSEERQAKYAALEEQARRKLPITPELLGRWNAALHSHTLTQDRAMHLRNAQWVGNRAKYDVPASLAKLGLSMDDYRAGETRSNELEAERRVAHKNLKAVELEVYGELLKKGVAYKIVDHSDRLKTNPFEVQPNESTTGVLGQGSFVRDSGAQIRLARYKTREAAEKALAGLNAKEMERVGVAPDEAPAPPKSGLSEWHGILGVPATNEALRGLSDEALARLMSNRGVMLAKHQKTRVEQEHARREGLKPKPTVEGRVSPEENERQRQEHLAGRGPLNEKATVQPTVDGPNEKTHIKHPAYSYVNKAGKKITVKPHWEKRRSPKK